MITSTQQGWLAAGYWPLWSTRRKLPWPLWYVAGGRIPSSAGYDGDGQISSNRRLKYGESAGVVAPMSRRGLVWTAGGCTVRRRLENSDGAGGGVGRGEGWRHWKRRDI